MFQYASLRHATYRPGKTACEQQCCERQAWTSDVGRDAELLIELTVSDAKILVARRQNTSSFWCGWLTVRNGPDRCDSSPPRSGNTGVASFISQHLPIPPSLPPSLPLFLTSWGAVGEQSHLGKVRSNGASVYCLPCRPLTLPPPPVSSVSAPLSARRGHEEQPLSGVSLILMLVFFSTWMMIYCCVTAGVEALGGRLFTHNNHRLYCFLLLRYKVQFIQQP